MWIFGIIVLSSILAATYHMFQVFKGNSEPAVTLYLSDEEMRKINEEKARQELAKIATEIYEKNKPVSLDEIAEIRKKDKKR